MIQQPQTGNSKWKNHIRNRFHLPEVMTELLFFHVDKCAVGKGSLSAESLLLLGCRSILHVRDFGKWSRSVSSFPTSRKNFLVTCSLCHHESCFMFVRRSSEGSLFLDTRLWRSFQSNITICSSGGILCVYSNHISSGAQIQYVRYQTKVWTQFHIQINGKVCPGPLTGALNIRVCSKLLFLKMIPNTLKAPIQSAISAILQVNCLSHCARWN